MYEYFSYEYMLVSTVSAIHFLCRLLVLMTRLWCVPTCADSEFSCCKIYSTVHLVECCCRTTWNYGALLLSVIICGYLTFGARPRWAITEDFNDTLPMSPNVDLCALLSTHLLHCVLYSSDLALERRRLHCHTFECDISARSPWPDLSLLNHDVLWSFEIAHNVFSTFAFLTFLVRVHVLHSRSFVRESRS